MAILTALENLQGFLTLISVLVSFMLGLLIIAKYFKFKDKNLLLVGISWIFLLSSYWNDAINYILILTIGTVLSREVYFFLGMGLIIIVIFTWMVAMTDMIKSWKDKQKLIVGISISIGIIFEIVFLVFLFTDPSLIGTQISSFYAEWELFVVFYLLFSLFLFEITGFLFVRKSLFVENPEIRLKGKFLAIAFLTFFIGTFIDAIGGLTEVTLVIARVFVITSSFTFYIGFTLPKIIKKLFIREKEI